MEAGALINDALPVTIAIMMLAVGMGLTVRDFAALLSSPKAAAIGLLGMFVAFPLLAFGVAAAMPLEPVLQVGLVLLAASPSASTSTAFAYAARGDTALSIALTTVSKIVPVLAIPFWVSLASQTFAGERTAMVLSFADTSESLALTVLLPTLAGMLLRHRFPVVAARLHPLLGRLGIAALVALIAAIVYRERNGIGGMFVAAGPAAFSLCVLGMALAFGVTTLFRLTPAQRSALTIEIGMQSGGTSIAIAAGVLHSPAMAVPAAIYSLIMYVAAGAFVTLVRAHDSRAASAVTSGSRT
jgi:BASS family bile acid:Na+ symporter